MTDVDVAQQQRVARARPWIERAIHAAVQDDERTERCDGAPSAANQAPQENPRPLPSLRAALAVATAANAVVMCYVRAARKAGHSWEEISAVLDLPITDVGSYH